MIEYVQTHWIFGFGFFAQAMFGMRILIQWGMAEKKSRTISPSLFWKLSLSGSALFLIYGILRHDFVIILGQLVAYFIYIRNLQLKKDWIKFSFVLRLFLLIFPIATIGWTLKIANEFNFMMLLTRQWEPILIIGILGQLILNYRFVYQLHYSEKRKDSILPLGFWQLSLTGSILVVIYAVSRYDPVLILSQGFALFPYVRNIILSRS